MDTLSGSLTPRTNVAGECLDDGIMVKMKRNILYKQQCPSDGQDRYISMYFILHQHVYFKTYIISIYL